MFGVSPLDDETQEFCENGPLSSMNLARANTEESSTDAPGDISFHDDNDDPISCHEDVRHLENFFNDQPTEGLSANQVQRDQFSRSLKSAFLRYVYLNCRSGVSRSEQDLMCFLSI